jgi:hypothetical protein
MLLAGCDRSIELWPRCALAALNLDEPTDYLPASTIQTLLYRILLGLKAKPGEALLVGGDAVVGDVLPVMWLARWNRLPRFWAQSI